MEKKSGRHYRKASRYHLIYQICYEAICRGQTSINLDLHATDDLTVMRECAGAAVGHGILIMALLISSSIICTTDMKPKLLGIPALGAIGYFLAILFTASVFISHFRSKKKKR